MHPAPMTAMMTQAASRPLVEAPAFESCGPGVAVVLLETTKMEQKVPVYPVFVQLHCVAPGTQMPPLLQTLALHQAERKVLKIIVEMSSKQTNKMFTNTCRKRSKYLIKLDFVPEKKKN